MSAVRNRQDPPIFMNHIHEFGKLSVTITPEEVDAFRALAKGSLNAYDVLGRVPGTYDDDAWAIHQARLDRARIAMTEFENRNGLDVYLVSGEEIQVNKELEYKLLP